MVSASQNCHPACGANVARRIDVPLPVMMSGIQRHARRAYRVYVIHMPRVSHIPRLPYLPVSCTLHRYVLSVHVCSDPGTECITRMCSMMKQPFNHDSCAGYDIMSTTYCSFKKKKKKETLNLDDCPIPISNMFLCFK